MKKRGEKKASRRQKEQHAGYNHSHGGKGRHLKNGGASNEREEKGQARPRHKQEYEYDTLKKLGRPVSFQRKIGKGGVIDGGGGGGAPR